MQTEKHSVAPCRHGMHREQTRKHGDAQTRGRFSCL